MWCIRTYNTFIIKPEFNMLHHTKLYGLVVTIKSIVRVFLAKVIYKWL